MRLFSRDRDEDALLAPPVAVDPPHPALASVEALEAGSLADTGAALLLPAFEDEPYFHSLHASEIRRDVDELIGPATGLKGVKLLQHLQDRDVQVIVNESLQILEQSLLVIVMESGNATPLVILTRRGRRALDSGALERWIDVPADPV